MYINYNKEYSLINLIKILKKYKDVVGYRKVDVAYDYRLLFDIMNNDTLCLIGEIVDQNTLMFDTPIDVPMNIHIMEYKFRIMPLRLQ